MTEGSIAIENASLGGQENEPKQPLKIAAEKIGFIDRFAEKIGEWCSSILVKETRQAVKSRQFFWSYVMLLVAVGVWTMLGVSTIGYSEIGRELLIGYWVILGFPLGIIIPFSAYRSMAREFEDGTISLISITTMKPSQIVIGKFGSALLQIVIYFSVLAPCILFTYMLRGIDISTILFGTVICLSGSVCLTIVGLFLAGAFPSRSLGVGVSVLFVLGLGFSYFLWCVAASEIAQMGFNFGDDPEMASVLFGMFGFAFSTAALLLVAAASQISFRSDNRSTPVRIMMLVQQAVFFAFLFVMIPTVARYSFDEPLVILLYVSGHYWLLMGFLMTGETTELSRRVQRSLPRSASAKSLFGLLMPGAGRGFLFAVANIWACGVLFSLIGINGELLFKEAAQKMSPSSNIGAAKFSYGAEVLVGNFFHCAYATGFLAVNFLIIRLIFRRNRSRDWSAGLAPLVSLITGSLLVVLSAIISFVVHMAFTRGTGADVSFALAGNWYYAGIETAIGTSAATILPWIGLVLVVASVPVFIATKIASRELLYRPVKTPERVVIETSVNKERTLPVGESIDEIFGELKPKRREL